MSKATNGTSKATKSDQSVAVAAAIRAAKTESVKAGKALAVAQTRTHDMMAKAIDGCLHAVHGAYTSGLLTVRGLSQGTMSMRDYLAAYFPTTTEQQASMWVGLARARHDLGIEWTSPLGTILRGKGAAGLSVVRKALLDPKATVESVTAAVATVYNVETGEKVDKAADPKARKTAAEKAAEKREQAKAALLATATPKVAADQAVDVLRKVWPNLTTAQRARIVKVVTGLDAKEAILAAKNESKAEDAA